MVTILCEGLGCPHKLWDPGAAYIHPQRIAQWSNAKKERAVPPLHAPTESPIYHARGAEIFPDSDTARYALHSPPKGDVEAVNASAADCTVDQCTEGQDHIAIAYSF